MDLASLYGGVLPIHPDLFALTDFSKKPQAFPRTQMRGVANYLRVFRPVVPQPHPSLLRSAFIIINPTGEPTTSGLPVSNRESQR
jgi:hypothetical protein